MATDGIDWEDKVDQMADQTCTMAEKNKVLLIEKDPILQALLVVWPLVEKEVVASGDDLWGGLVFSFDEWCRLAGVPPSGYNLWKCERLISLGLVFPNGRLHYWIKLYLDQQAGCSVKDEE